MKKTQRLLALLLALVMVVSLLPVSAFAVEDAASPDVPAVEAQEVQPVEEQQDEEINTPVTQAAGSKVTVKYTVNGTEQTWEETPLRLSWELSIWTEVTMPAWSLCRSVFSHR